jgi:hypothetical protein
MSVQSAPTIAAPRATADPALQLPRIGLGTRLLLDEDCSRVVEQAISIEYRAADTVLQSGLGAEVGHLDLVRPFDERHGVRVCGDVISSR